MPTFAKTVLSGSTDGKAINITATSSPGTTIHTGSSTAADLHEVWLYAINYGTSSQWITVQWGGTASADSYTTLVDPTVGMVLIAPGLVIKGNATPNVIRAFATLTNSIAVIGYVHTIV